MMTLSYQYLRRLFPIGIVSIMGLLLIPACKKSPSETTLPEGCPNLWQGVIQEWTSGGTVIEPSGTVTNQETGETASIQSDGSFSMSNPGAGTYTLEFNNSAAAEPATMEFQVRGPCEVQFALRIDDNVGLLREKLHFFNNQGDIMGVIGSVDRNARKFRVTTMGTTIEVTYGSNTEYSESSLYSPMYNENEIAPGQRVSVQGPADEASRTMQANSITLVEDNPNAPRREDCGPIIHRGEDWVEIPKPNQDLIRYYYDEDTQFEGGLTPGDLTEGLSIAIKGVRRASRWHALTIRQDACTGTGGQEPDIDVSPTEVNFGQVQVGQSATRTVTVRNTGNVDLELVSFERPNRPFDIESNTCGSLLSPGATCHVTYSCRPSSAATFSDRVEIRSNDPNEDPVTLTLLCEGTTQAQEPDIEVSPTSIDIVCNNQITVNVQNVGSSELIINNVQIINENPPGIFSLSNDTCSNAILKPGSGCTVDVLSQSNTTIIATADLEIQSNDPDEPTVRIPMTCSM